MIKILNVITGGLRREGITSSQLVYAKYLDKSVFRMDVLAVHNNDSAVIKQFEGYGCNVIEAPDRLRHLFKYRKFLKGLIKKNKYDVIHVHGSSSLMCIELSIAKRLGVATRIAHSRNTMCNKRFLHSLLYPVFKRSYNVALACGKEAGVFLFKKRPFSVLHNGKELSDFSYDPIMREIVRNSLSIPLGTCALGFVGKLNGQKNLKFLIEVFSSLKSRGVDCSLFLIGDGPQKDELEMLAQENDLKNVHFLGNITNVNDVMQAMDIMCLPSLYEGLPNVVIEWQASGLKCLVSDKVTGECSVSDDVVFLPIDRGIEPWCDRIVMEMENKTWNGRMKRSDNNCKLLKEAGFDIIESIEELSKIYSTKL